MVLSKRMFIIDDKEFVGQKKSGSFLTLDQIKFVALLMNRVAYEIFEQVNNLDLYGIFLTTNLKEALSRLVCRDERLKMFGDEFWVINK